MTSALHPQRARRWMPDREWRSVYASVAKAHMQFATFANPIVPREGFGANFKSTQLVLTEKATRLISSLYASAQPQTVTILPQGSAVLTKLQAVAASTLNSVFNQPAPEPPPSSNFVVGDPFGTFSLLAQAQ